jgi:phosphohistidine phosphatase
MKRELILIRHTKSGHTVFMADFDRPIKEDREEDAKNIGVELKKLKLHPDKVICSPALRTKQTAELVLAKLDYDLQKIQYDIRLYESSAVEYLKVVRETEDKVQKLVLVGHNPSITDFANVFLKKRIDEMPTTGVAWFEFESPDWKISETTSRTLTHFLSPKTI